MNKSLLCLLFFGTCFASSMTVIGVKVMPDNLIGLFAQLELETFDGSGRIFFNTMPLAETDTQVSARLAIEVACQNLEINCNTKDFFYTINANSPMIGGPSAGAAMAVLAMSELLGIPLRGDVAITGTINPDKSIGVVGGVVEKARILQGSSIKKMLVPAGTKYLFENESLSIEIIEVSTINEAFNHFTGMAFHEPSSEVNKSVFNEFMELMGKDLIFYAVSNFEDLIEKNASCSLNLSDYLIIESLIDSAKNDIEKIDELYSAENYYSASSYSVRVGINSLYASYLIDYFSGNLDLNAMIIDTNDSINEFEKNFSKKLIIDNPNDFEAISISIERMFEARKLLNTSINYLNNNDSFGAIYNLAFSKVRLKTSESWFGLKDLLIGDYYYLFNQNDFLELAYIRIENAKTLLNYAKSMKESYYTFSAQELIDKSNEAYLNGDIIYSLFESLKSIANSNLALSLSGVTDENLEQRVDLLMDLAAKNINSARSKGIIPILAYSYYEYGQNFMDSEPLEAILFFEYSKQFSILSEQLVNAAIPKIEEQAFDLMIYIPKITISLLIGIFTSLMMLEAYYENALLNKRKR